MGSWPTLEIAKLIVGVLTPLSVALLGWLFSRQLKRLDLSNWGLLTPRQRAAL